MSLSIKTNEVKFLLALSLGNTVDNSFSALTSAHFFVGSDYFTENFQLKENKTRMRNIHPCFFHLLF